MNENNDTQDPRLAVETIMRAFRDAFVSASNVEELRPLIQRYPEAVQTEIESSHALHFVCKGRAPIDVMALLIDMHPEAASDVHSSHDISNWWEEALPLHVLLKYFTSPDEPLLPKVKLLVERFPESITVPDGYGHFSLHSFCNRSQNKQLVDCAHKSCNTFWSRPLMVPLAQDAREGLLPLHLASVARNVEIIQMLINLCPEAVMIQDDLRGRLPIHRACTFSAFAARESSFAVIQLLMRNYDGEAHHYNGFGCTE